MKPKMHGAAKSSEYAAGSLLTVADLPVTEIAAILAANVVSYHRLFGADEDRTLALSAGTCTGQRSRWWSVDRAPLHDVGQIELTDLHGPQPGLDQKAHQGLFTESRQARHGRAGDTTLRGAFQREEVISPHAGLDALGEPDPADLHEVVDDAALSTEGTIANP